MSGNDTGVAEKRSRSWVGHEYAEIGVELNHPPNRTRFLYENDWLSFRPRIVQSRSIMFSSCSV